MKSYFFQDYLLLTVESNGRQQFDRYFDNEYVRINETNVSEKSPAYTVALEIVDEFPEQLPADAIVQKYDFKKIFTFEYAICGYGTKAAKVYFKDHFVSRLYVTAAGVFLQTQVLEPVMYLSFLKQNILFMHSAGVSKDNLAYVFPAFGGTGKTTTSMSLLSKGYDFLGDDLLIIDPEKKAVFPYPRPLHIFTYNVRNLQGAKIPWHVVFVIYFKNVIRFFLERILRTEFMISTRVHADTILPGLKLSTPAKLHQLVFLKKEGEHENVDLSYPEQIEKHAKTIIGSADLNFSLYALTKGKLNKEDILAEEVRVASEVLKNTHSFSYLNTRIIDLNDIPDYLLPGAGE